MSDHQEIETSGRQHHAVADLAALDHRDRAVMLRVALVERGRRGIETSGHSVAMTASNARQRARWVAVDGSATTEEPISRTGTVMEDKASDHGKNDHLKPAKDGLLRLETGSRHG